MTSAQNGNDGSERTERSTQTHESLLTYGPPLEDGDFSTVSSPSKGPRNDETDSTVKKEVAESQDEGPRSDGGTSSVNEDSWIQFNVFGHQCAHSDGDTDEIQLHCSKQVEDARQRPPIQSSDSLEETNSHREAWSGICSRSWSLTSSLSTESSGFQMCDACKAADGLFLCSSSKAFWDSIESSSCCTRVWKNVHDKLFEVYPDDNAIKKARVKNLLKSVLRVSESLDTVNVQNFLDVLRFFDPFKSEENPSTSSAKQCIVLQEMDRLVANSFLKNPKRSTRKLCWFAGEMSRDEAEGKLDGKVPGTFMIRMSATHREEGSFVLSLVMADETIEHFLIEGHPSQAVQSNPFSLCLTFQGHTFSGLPDLVNEYRVRT